MKTIYIRVLKKYEACEQTVSRIFGTLGKKTVKTANNKRKHLNLDDQKPLQDNSTLLKKLHSGEFVDALRAHGIDASSNATQRFSQVAAESKNRFKNAGVGAAQKYSEAVEFSKKIHESYIKKNDEKIKTETETVFINVEFGKRTRNLNEDKDTTKKWSFNLSFNLTKRLKTIIHLFCKLLQMLFIKALIGWLPDFGLFSMISDWFPSLRECAENMSTSGTFENAATIDTDAPTFTEDNPETVEDPEVLRDSAKIQESVEESIDTSAPFAGDNSRSVEDPGILNDEAYVQFSTDKPIESTNLNATSISDADFQSAKSSEFVMQNDKNDPNDFQSSTINTKETDSDRSFAASLGTFFLAKSIAGVMQRSRIRYRHLWKNRQ